MELSFYGRVIPHARSARRVANETFFPARALRAVRIRRLPLFAAIHNSRNLHV